LEPTLVNSSPQPSNIIVSVRDQVNIELSRVKN
jgi:hypothetical protein